MSTKSTILVYGAGGTQGGAVARKLLSEGHTVRTIVRDVEKVANLKKQGIQAFIGDLSDPKSLVRAHEGVERVFLLLPVDYNIERTRSYVKHTVDAAKAAKIELLVISNSLYVPEENTDTVAIELKRELNNYVKESGLPAIILQPTLYLENFFVPGVLANQTLAYPVPAEKAIAWISIDDAAEYATFALNHPELAGQTFNIVGPESLTGNQLAERFTLALQQNFRFFSLSVEAFQGALTPVLGGENAAGLAGLYSWIGVNSAALPTPEQVDSQLRTAVPGTTVEAWIVQNKANGLFDTI